MMKRFLVITLTAGVVLAQNARAEDESDNPPKPHAAQKEAAAQRGSAEANRRRSVPQQNAQSRRNFGNGVNRNQVDQSVRRDRRLENGDGVGKARGINARAGANAAATTNAQIGANNLRDHRLELTPEQRQARRAANQNRMQQFNRNGFAEAARRHNHEFHDHDWWRHHHTRIILIGGGFYFWDAGWWYPAWGYSTAYNYYPYDGPIYANNDLSPDRVIADVQEALQQDGYYDGYVDGELGPQTREAIARYQRDNGLLVTSAIDEPTLAALGLL